MSGHPVIIATGEKYQAETDFVGGGGYSLDHTRTYRAFGSTGNMFGPKWLGAYDFGRLNIAACTGYLCMGPLSVAARLPDGSTYTYTWEWVNSLPPAVQYTVVGAAAAGVFRHNEYDPAGGWSLTKDRLTYAYSELGDIQSVSTTGGVTLMKFVYGNVPNQPLQVINTAGQSVNFNWANNRVQSIQDSNGSVWTYGVSDRLNQATSESA